MYPARYPFGYDKQRHDEMSDVEAATDIISRTYRKSDHEERVRLITAYATIIREKRNADYQRSRDAHPASYKK